MLHLTNGSVAAVLLRHADMPGDIVSWDDVLHEGPVPEGIGPAALRALRAGFLAVWSGQSFEAITRQLATRDAVLDDVSRYPEVVLWFEHDLYDQLQLLQIVDRLPAAAPPVTMPPVPDYLGRLSIDQIAPLFARRAPLTSAQRSAATDAWHALRSVTPQAVVNVLPRLDALPCLGPALRRHLQQFPSVRDGLSRTERQAMMAMRDGATEMRDIYRVANHEAEESVFMADLPFLHHLRPLAACATPLVEVIGHVDLTMGSRVRLTPDGERVLRGEADRVTLCGIDRWLGGVHLAGYGPVWRWDEASGTAVFG